MKTTRWQVSVLALLMALAACSKKSEETGSEGTDNVQAQAELAASGAEVSGNSVDPKNLGALVDLIAAEVADLPRAEFDPAVLAAKLGKDPQAHFEWVRDHTWWAPYRGLLRGSKGVMLDRVGSSLDRAVLLGDLLRRAGYAVRLAHAELPENVAREAFSKVRPIPDQRREAVATPRPNTERQRLAETLIPGFARAAQGLAAESKRRREIGDALVSSQSAMLYGAVKGAVSGDDNAAGQPDFASLRDHWWVEVDEHGEWIAMDVLKSDAKPGSALISATQRSDWNAANDFPSIPESDWHTVQIRIVVERYLAGDISESTVFETTLRPAEVFDKPVALVHFPKPWPDAPIDPTTNPDALKSAALNVRVWTPVLRIGDRYMAQSGFTESADIKAHPFDPTADLGGGGLFGGLDSALGGGEEYEPYASAEWIDYEIRAPGQAERRIRRPLFDLLGPGRRLAKDANFNGSAENRRLERSEVLLSETRILLQPCEFPDEFVAHITVGGIVEQQAAIKKLLLEPDAEKRRREANRILGEHTWGSELAFASWRSALGNQHGDWLIGRTNVVTLRVGRRLTNENASAVSQLIDIVANSTDPRPGSARDPYLVRVEQGVADTVAELLALTGDTDKADNTAAIFDSVDTRQNRGALVAPGDLAGIQKLSWPDDESARLAEDANAGNFVYALRQPVELDGVQRVGWWRVDAATGETVGVMDNGFHPAALEDTFVRQTPSGVGSAGTAITPAAGGSVLPGMAMGGVGVMVGLTLCVVSDVLVGAVTGRPTSRCGLIFTGPPAPPPPPPQPPRRPHRHNDTDCEEIEVGC
jgi:hypothetical protein